MLQAISRECGTINYTAQFGGQRNGQAAQRMTKIPPIKLRAGSCTMEEGVAQQNRKVTIEVTVHDLTVRRRLSGAGWRHLRQKSLKICRQNNIYCQKLGGTVGFEFKTPYKLRVSVQQRTLCALKIIGEFNSLLPMS